MDGDRLIVTPGGEGAAVVALDKKTGVTLWKAAVPGGDLAGYASAVAVESGGVRQIVQFLGRGVVGLDAATGKLLWRFDDVVDKRFGVHAATPVVSGDRVYVSSAAGGALAQLKSNGGSFSAEPVYLERKAPVALGGSVRVGDHLYGTTNAALICIEYATGKLKWEERSVGAASVIYADGRLYLRGENGEVALVEASPERYRQLGRFAPQDPPARGMAKAWNYPVISNGRLYVRDLGTLWVYDIRDGGG